MSGKLTVPNHDRGSTVMSIKTFKIPAITLTVTGTVSFPQIRKPLYVISVVILQRL